MRSPKRSSRRQEFRLRYLAALLLTTLLSTTVLAAPGDLDPAFSGDGKLTDGLFRGGDSAQGVAVQADGKIVVAGSSWTGLSTDFAIARYNADGSLDTTFGIGGKVWTDFNSGNDWAYSIAIQTDGKIVAAGAGWVPALGSDFALVRYNTDGSPDATFGTGGKVTTDFNSGYDGEDIAVSVAIQSDGKIVAAGQTRLDSALARYNPDGSLDTTFDSDGKLTSNFLGTDSASSVAIQTDGKIVTAGRSHLTATPNFVFTLVRYNVDGSLDNAFDGDGRVTTQSGSGDSAAISVAIHTDGRIVAAGLASSGGNTSNFVVARFNTNGSPDGAFATNPTMPGFSGYAAARSVVIQPDGKIIAAGNAPGTDSTYPLIVFRFNANFTTDPTFGTEGMVTTPVGPNAGAYAIAVQPDGKLAAAGTYRSNSDADFAVIRYNTDGSLDTSFDGDGKVSTDFGFFQGNVLRDTAIQQDGKIVAVGDARSDFAVVRYNSDGSPDTTFGGTGKVTTNFSNNGQSARSVAIQADGKIVAAGSATFCDFFKDCFSAFALARFNTDGSLDTSFDGDGKVADFGTYGDGANDVAIQPDGKIVAAGNSQNLFAVYRYNTDGSLDTSFNGDGKVTTPIGSGDGSATAVFIQPDGKLVAAGISPLGNGDFAIVRYNTNGSLDTTFDGDGIVTTNINSNDVAQDVAIQSDGKIVVGGCTSQAAGFLCNQFALARYNANGSLDTTFDGDGKATTFIFNGFRYTVLGSIAIQPDGMITASGYADNGSNNDIALARYHANGSLDTTFGGGDGITTADFDSSSDNAYGMALDSAGRAVVVGESNGGFAIARVMLGPASTPFDFDGDGRSDISVFRPSDRIWYLNQSTVGFSATQFGISTDKIVPADYDADGKTDIAVYRDGTWYWLDSLSGSFHAIQVGVEGDIPVPADYTGDGRDELAIYRNGQWWALDPSNNQSSLVNFGSLGDKPVPADYDGDGLVDQAVYRDGVWHLNRSTQGYAAVAFGLPSDRPVGEDYDGDGKADLAVYRDGTWYLLQSTQGFAAVQWGIATDIPAPADYDGDGKADIAVFRDGTWYLLQSNTGGLATYQFGLPGDRPVESAYNSQ